MEKSFKCRYFVCCSLFWLFVLYRRGEEVPVFRLLMGSGEKPRCLSFSLFCDVIKNCQNQKPIVGDQVLSRRSTELIYIKPVFHHPTLSPTFTQPAFYFSLSVLVGFFYFQKIQFHRIKKLSSDSFLFFRQMNFLVQFVEEKKGNLISSHCHN